MIDASLLQKRCADLLDKAKQRGMAEVDIAAGAVRGLSVTVRLGQPEQIVYSNEQSLDLTVYQDHRQASLSTSDVSEEALDQLLEKACAMVSLTDRDPYAGLAEAELMATHFPDLDLYHPWDITTEKAIEIATNCEESGRAVDRRIDNSEGAWVETSTGFDVLLNSHGFSHVMHSSHHSLGVSYIAKQKQAMERGFEFSSAVAVEDLADPTVIAKQAAKQALDRLGSRSLSTRKCPVVFIAEEAKSLFSSFLYAISGSNIYRQSSFLLNTLGEPIFPASMQIYERPYLKRGMGSSAYDEDGVQTRENQFIQNGILQQYAQSVYTARRLGMKTTANAGGVHNLFVTMNQDISFAALLKEMDTGFLVTELMGQGANIVTGDYSRGAAGFWVERGEIQFPVHEVTIASDLKTIFSRIQKIANDVDVRGNYRVGSVLIEEMTLAGGIDE